MTMYLLAKDTQLITDHAKLLQYHRHIELLIFFHKSKFHAVR